MAPLAVLLAGCALAGCATGDAVVFKALAGEMPGEKGTIPPHLASGPVGVEPPALGKTRFRVARKLVRPGKRPDKEAGKRATLEEENTILAALLPKTLSPEEIATALEPVKDAILGAGNDGQATGIAMKHLKGSGAAVEGKDVSAAVRTMRA